MRVLVVSQYFWPETFRINDLAKELVARGHEVTVLTGAPNYPNGSIYPAFKNNPREFDGYEGVNIVRVPLLPRGNGAFRLLLNYVSFFVSGVFWGPPLLRKRKFDVVFICQLSPITIAIPAILIKKLRNIPSVHWVLDLWPQSLSAVGATQSRWMLGLLDYLSGFIYRRADLVLGQSRSFIPEIAKHTKTATKLEYFPSWPDPLSKPETSELAPELNRSTLTTIMFAGNIGEAQDFPAILRAAELTRDLPVRWVILGDGRKAEWVRTAIKERGLDKKMAMLGRFEQDRMPQFFRHADVLLVSLADQPVFSMTIPGKVQSYLSAGIPILGMLNGEGADVINESKSGVAVAAGDSEGLALAIRNFLLLTKDERAKLGQNGRLYCERHFNRSTLVDQLESWFQELTNKNTEQVQK